MFFRKRKTPLRTDENLFPNVVYKRPIFLERINAFCYQLLTIKNSQIDREIILRWLYSELYLWPLPIYAEILPSIQTGLFLTDEQSKVYLTPGLTNWISQFTIYYSTSASYKQMGVYSCVWYACVYYVCIWICIHIHAYEIHSDQ